MDIVGGEAAEQSETSGAPEKDSAEAGGNDEDEWGADPLGSAGADDADDWGSESEVKEGSAQDESPATQAPEAKIDDWTQQEGETDFGTELTDETDNGSASAPEASPAEEEDEDEQFTGTDVFNEALDALEQDEEVKALEQQEEVVGKFALDALGLPTRCALAVHHGMGVIVSPLRTVLDRVEPKLRPYMVEKAGISWHQWANGIICFDLTAILLAAIFYSC
ncbi:MAG: hypothetical protein HQL31_03985 [Planctomycetes bacterium]|nr:hypothetical protein [Planctomycetota bacterium]